MNIIKFKDVINIGDRDFNESLKGKYAYFIQMRWAVPFEDMTIRDYIDAERQGLKYLESRAKCNKIRFWDMDSPLKAYVDDDRTDHVNDIKKYEDENRYSTTPDITIDKVRTFRTWLASSLLIFIPAGGGCGSQSQDNPTNRHMLEYYKDNMSNEITKVLQGIRENTFSFSTGSLMTPTWGGPGCISGNCNNQLSMNKLGSTGCISNGYNSCGCDSNSTSCPTPLEAYTKFQYTVMVKLFSDIMFWSTLPSQFLATFKLYIDNIIKLNLPLTKADPLIDMRYDCLCDNGMSNTEQMTRIAMLGRLSHAIQYIIEDQICNNKNTIAIAFKDWAETLYELMEWTTPDNNKDKPCK